MLKREDPYIAYSDYQRLFLLYRLPYPRETSFEEVNRALDALNQVHDAIGVPQLALHLTDENKVVRTVAKRRLQELHRQWKPWECWIMNKIDIRYWLCDCHYEAPYGKVTSAWCTKHG